MGVAAQQLSTKGRDTAEGIYVPVHIRRLLDEFSRRYDELRQIRRREMTWFILVLFLGFLDLTSLMLSSTPILLTFCSLLAFFATLAQYLRVKEASNHAYVNVHILHHHLLGKLEVGLCEHDTVCQCTENVKKYMWIKYKISLYENLL
jgi:hypothetical protein